MHKKLQFMTSSDMIFPPTLLYPQDVSARMLQHHTRAANEARQQSGERVKSVSEQLADALADITMKDNLVKQHAKVAEEAVCGI
jgi:hypothetical protein